LIFGPNLAVKIRLVSFNGMQSRVITGLLTGHNTLSRHFYTTGLQKALCVGRAEYRKIPQLMFCVHEKL